MYRIDTPNGLKPSNENNICIYDQGFRYYFIAGCGQFSLTSQVKKASYKAKSLKNGIRSTGDLNLPFTKKPII